MAQSEYEPCGCKPDGLPLVVTMVGGVYKVLCMQCGQEGDLKVKSDLDFARRQVEVSFDRFPSYRALMKEPKAGSSLIWVGDSLPDI